MINKREIGSLAMKLAGIYAIIQMVTLASTSGLFLRMNYLSSHDRILSWCSYWFILLLIGAFGFFLIRWSTALSKGIFPEESDTPQISSPTFHDVQLLAFSLIGVFLIVTTIPRILTYVLSLVSHLVSIGFDIRGVKYWHYQWPECAGTVIKMLIGIWLFLGGRGLSNLWNKMRTGGLPSVDM